MKAPAYHGASVYRLTHAPSGRVYVGSTIRTMTRLHAHLGELRRGEHGNNALQSAFTTDGEAAFSVDILERVSVTGDDRAHLREREDYWIAALHATEPAHGFNKHERASQRAEVPGPAPRVRREFSISRRTNGALALMALRWNVSESAAMERAIRNQEKLTRQPAKQPTTTARGRKP